MRLTNLITSCRELNITTRYTVMNNERGIETTVNSLPIIEGYGDRNRIIELPFIPLQTALDFITCSVFEVYQLLSAKRHSYPAL